MLPRWAGGVMLQIVKVQTIVRWEYYQDPVSHRWIAVCPSLKLTIEGDTHTELRENIEDSLRLFMRSIWMDGTIHKMAEQAGIIIGQIPHNVPANDVSFDV